MAGHKGGGGHERWLITYADMLTLLLAFFVIMYSISKADAQRFKKFQEGMQQAFHLGVLEGRDAVSIQDTAGAMVGVDSSTAMGPATLPAAVAPQPLPTVANPVAAATPFVVPSTADRTLSPSATPIATASTTAPRTAPVTAPTTADVQTAKQLQATLDGLVTSNNAGGAQVSVQSEGIVISLYGVLAFPSGDAELQPSGRAVLTKLAGELRGLPYDIRVEGNTDSLQPDGGPYPSNWELSTARALAVTHFLIDSAHLAPTRLSAVGLAEFHPVASNETRDGRSRNRRVDLVLIHRSQSQTSTEGNP